MALIDDLRTQLEAEESRTVGSAFGGQGAARASYSVASVRDWLLAQPLAAPATEFERALTDLEGLPEWTEVETRGGCPPAIRILDRIDESHGRQHEDEDPLDAGANPDAATGVVRTISGNIPTRQ